MKIAVVSDTHMPHMAKYLPRKLVEGLQDADYILHAGDWTTLDVYDELQLFAPVDGVAGNNDGMEIVRKFGYAKIVAFGSKRIGIVHGHGAAGTTEERAYHAFKSEKVDCIIFGHSHVPVMKEIGGILMFNPGSPTDKRRQPQYSYGWLEISDKLKARHIFYDDKY